MLSRFDDYPIHQTPEPIAHAATSDRNVYDRYWFNGYADDGEFYFGIGVGAVSEPRHHGLRLLDRARRRAARLPRLAPRAARAEPRSRSGPFRIEIVEPMKRAARRARAERDRHRVPTSTSPRAPRASRRAGRPAPTAGGIMMDATRFDAVRPLAGRRSATTARRSRSTRRACSAPRTAPGASARSARPTRAARRRRELPQIFFLWAPLHWKDRCTHCGVFEDARRPCVAPGRRDRARPTTTPDEIPGVEDPAIALLAARRAPIDYVPGHAPRAAAPRSRWSSATARATRSTLEPLLCFRMKGIGYTHPTWGHGIGRASSRWRGESWKRADLDQMAIENQHIQQVVRARMGGERGHRRARADRHRPARDVGADRFHGRRRVVACTTTDEGKPR